MTNIHLIAKNFQATLQKQAAKEKTSRKRLSKELEKAKLEYGKLKSLLDDLESKKSDLDIKLNKIKSECTSARKNMVKLHKTIQSMDISNASDAIFYNDESDDVGYVINGKEFHLDFDNDGELSLIPMLAHRRSKKQKDKEEAEAEELELDQDLASAEDELTKLYNDLLD